MDGQAIKPKDKKCPKCSKLGKIVDRDASAAVLQCKCGYKWTVYFKGAKT